MMEGAGVRICRTLGTHALRNLDPFLMLDELRMPAHKATAGFPSHPHRGFETCSIMITGKMEHKDSVGNHVSIPASVNSTAQHYEGLDRQHSQAQKMLMRCAML